MTIDVETCGDCPLEYCDREGDMRCNWPALPPEAQGGFTTCGPPPDWCPLRERDHVLALKDKP